MFNCLHCGKKKMIEIEDTKQLIMRINNKNFYKKKMVCTNCKYKIDKELYKATVNH